MSCMRITKQGMCPVGTACPVRNTASAALLRYRQWFKWGTEVQVVSQQGERMGSRLVQPESLLERALS